MPLPLPRRQPPRSVSASAPLPLDRLPARSGGSIDSEHVTSISRIPPAFDVLECYRCLRCCAPAAARVARKGLNGAARGTSTTAVQCTSSTCSTRGRASGHIFSFELESDTHFRPQSVLF